MPLAKPKNPTNKKRNKCTNIDGKTTYMDKDEGKSLANRILAMIVVVVVVVVVVVDLLFLFIFSSIQFFPARLLRKISFDCPNPRLRSYHSFLSLELTVRCEI